MRVAVERGAMDLARSEHGFVVLAAIAVGMVCWGAARRRRTRGWEAVRGVGRLPRDGATLWFLAIVATGVALLGPRWGHAPGKGPAPGHEVVLLVDVSRSMAAEDAVPNRLGAAVAGANAMVEALGRTPGERVAVVAFAGRGVLRCPMTANLGAVREALARLRPGVVRPGGSDLGAALDAAREAFPESNPGEEDAVTGRSVVVFSDGEDLEGRAKQALAGRLAAGIVVHAVAIGDAAIPGATVPVRDESGKIIALTYEGEIVRSRREDVTLREIAVATGGTFIPLGLSRPEEVAGLYETSIAPSERARLEAKARGAPLDRSALFAMVALAAGLAGVLPVGRSRRGLCTVVLAVLAIGADRPTAPGDPGLSAFRAGQLDVALSAYEREIAAFPEAAVPRFNAAVVLQRQGRFTDADARYAEALARVGNQPALAAIIEFARGNNAYFQGDREAAMAHYDACLARSGENPEIAEIHRDAKINREFVSRQSASNPAPEEPTPPGATPAPDEDQEGMNKEEEPGQTPMPAPPGTHGGEPTKVGREGLDPSGTPEEQLEQAVERIRRRTRPHAEASSSTVDSTRRDW